MKAAVLEILLQEGFVKNVEKEENTLKVTLKYGSNNEKVITGIKRISKPGLRVYAKKEELPQMCIRDRWYLVRFHCQQKRISSQFFVLYT